MQSGGWYSLRDAGALPTAFGPFETSRLAGQFPYLEDLIFDWFAQRFQPRA
jgi:hypothetical protein